MTTTPKRIKAPAKGAAVDKSRYLEITHEAGKTPDRQIADMMAEGLIGNASTAIRYSSKEHEGQSLTDMVASLKALGLAVNGGDMTSLERTLTAQVVALNTMFAELARRAGLNMGEHLDAADRYLRLALRAQGQCRASIETLAAIKNPPVVFARQANINNGGNQQVNNSSPGKTEQYGYPGARTEDSEIEQSKLLPAGNEETVSCQSRRINPACYD